MFAVTSDLEVCGKTKGDSLSQIELDDAGANIEALIEAGHIQLVGAKTPATNEGDK